MIRHSRLPENILDLLPKAQDFLRSRADIAFAYLFGSLARGESLPLSDLDIAVYLRDDRGHSATKMKILDPLVDILGTEEIDLVILNHAPLSLNARILLNKRLIADNDPYLRHQWESLTLRKYFDFSYMEKDILERRYLHGG